MKIRTFLPVVALFGLLAAGCSPEATTARTGRPDAAWDAELAYRRLRDPDVTPTDPEKIHPLGKRESAKAALRRSEKQKLVNLSFQRTPAHEVVSRMATLFKCKISITPAASLYMHEEDLRITARADRVPANLAFETLRGHLESKGLVMEESRSTSLLTPQQFIVDRSRIREASVPAAR
ncbi:MAG: hypothetical protein ACYTGB_16875 [Planctomycetota bacterium]|jgi:hypothetical protein